MYDDIDNDEMELYILISKTALVPSSSPKDKLLNNAMLYKAKSKP